jgi:hypothetical protein
MKFYKFSEIPIQSDDQIFKASPVGVGISFIVISAITTAALLLGIRGGEQYGINLPRAIFYIVAVFAGLFGLVAFHSFRASLKPTNWLLRCNNSGVIIHFRSYLNWRFPTDSVQAVGFDYSEIAWARTVKERRNSPSLGNSRRTQTELLTFVDFCLAHVDTTDLEKQLQQEASIEPEGIMISRDYPVQVKPGGIVELRWSSISPSPRRAIQYLSQHIMIADADSRKVDLTHQGDLPPGAEDDKILELAKSGDEMGAMTLTRQAYGCSLSEAKDFVAKLRSR